MLITIPDVLSAEQVIKARKMLDSAEWVDGRVTAGHQSARTKDNVQLPEGHPVAVEIGEMILTGLAQSPLFMSAALPLRVFPPLFNRYSGGQSYSAGSPHRRKDQNRPFRDPVPRGTRGV
jgi:PKHD-type hydroxylase